MYSVVYIFAANENMFCSAESYEKQKYELRTIYCTSVLTIGKCRSDVAFTGIVGKIGPTTSPIIDILALFDP